MKQKIVALAIVMMSICTLGVVQSVSAACVEDQVKGQFCCGGVQTSIIQCTQPGGNDADPKDSGVWGVLLLVLNIMTGGVGILAVGGVVYGAIMYTTSSDSAEQTKQAKDIIRNVVIGLIAYAAMYLGLNFLIPGGIFT